MIHKFQFPKTYTIETIDLLLRVPNEEDIPFVFSATRYKGFNDGMQWDPPKSIAELTAPLQRSHEKWDKGEAFGFTIENKSTSEFLGRISIRPTTENHVWNVGFWTHPEQQNKGVMSEALAAVVNFGFKQLQATRIEAAYATWNKASEKVLLKNGFTFVEYIEKGIFKNGKWVPENLVAINKK